MQWGRLSAKLWGTDQRRPILALHGWQDNAGTWDPIAPMLCKNRSILALDFPGHGYSSWIPPGKELLITIPIYPEQKPNAWSLFFDYNKNKF